MDLGLRGRVAIVTGGSSGIGRATVLTLIAEGCFVAACARRADRLASLAAEVGDSRRLLTLAADVTDPKAMQRLVDITVAEFGGIDAVAALAGQGIRGSAFDLSGEDWQQEISGTIPSRERIVSVGPWQAGRTYEAAS
jgi:NAD(P)-dependent dehydrogenase (short-subunit alcohol dehydrogenase family)